MLLAQCAADPMANWPGAAIITALILGTVIISAVVLCRPGCDCDDRDDEDCGGEF